MEPRQNWRIDYVSSPQLEVPLTAPVQSWGRFSLKRKKTPAA
jgi:hypothetical protein